MQDVLGGLYSNDTTGTYAAYDNTVLLNSTAANGFETGATSLADALKKYAENTQAATGVAYNDDGSVATTYTKASSTDYDGLTAELSLKAAIEQLDGNIGTAIAGTTRSATGSSTVGTATVNANIKAIDTYLGGDVSAVARTTGKLVASNTVKGNFEALDAAIGTDTDLLTTTVSTATVADNNGVKVANSVNRNIAALNAAVGNVANLHDLDDSKSIGNALATRDSSGAVTGKPATIVEALNNIDSTLGTIHGLNDKRGADAKGNLAKGSTVEDHLVTLDDAIGDRSQFASSHYVRTAVSNADAIMGLDTALASTDHRVRNIEKELRGGFASMAALSALVPNARAANDTQIAVGTGSYRDHVGMAVGAFHYFNDNVLGNFGISYGGERSAVFRAGLTFGW